MKRGNDCILLSEFFHFEMIMKRAGDEQWSLDRKWHEQNRAIGMNNVDFRF